MLGGVQNNRRAKTKTVKNNVLKPAKKEEAKSRVRRGAFLEKTMYYKQQKRRKKKAVLGGVLF